MALDADFGVSISSLEFEDRFLALHQQLFASTDQPFDAVTEHVYRPPHGMYQVDHCFVHDGSNWHLFYVTGDMSNTEEWIKRYRAGDMEGANEVCLEPGNGHAVGADPFSLQFRDHVFFSPQGRFDLASRANPSIFRYRDRWGMSYGVRGEDFIGFSLAWSDDLSNWELDPDNPYWSAPDWCKRGSTAKDAHVMQVDGIYLIYYIVTDQEGYACIALVSTTDWQRFHDEGAVYRAAPALRGTMGIESPHVHQRDGLWHLFFTYGEGLHHSVSASPTGFVRSRGTTWDVGTGAYRMGPFHATELIEHDGRWLLSSDRKEETRRLNRVAGRLCYRGSYEDEKTLEEGLYMAELSWDGDRPVLRRPEH